MNEYEGVRRVAYGGDGDDECDGGSFVPVCCKCSRFVRADRKVWFQGGQPTGKNATCKRCGRTQMLFEGFIG